MSARVWDYFHHADQRIAAISCAELDQLAALPPEPLPESLDVWDALAIQARRAQIHIELRMELMAEEERQQQKEEVRL